MENEELEIAMKLVGTAKELAALEELAAETMAESIGEAVDQLAIEDLFDESIENVEMFKRSSVALEGAILDGNELGVRFHCESILMGMAAQTDARFEFLTALTGVEISD
jgi:ribosomal protein S6E (S10)